MMKAQVQWLQRNDLTRLDYDARYAAEYSNLIGLQDYKTSQGSYAYQNLNMTLNTLQ